jgi:hypothetical protein
MCAVSCAQLASTRIGWANKAKGIVVDTARLVEVESNSHCRRAVLHQASRANTVHGTTALCDVVAALATVFWIIR